MSIYILELEQQKYYVGFTHNIKKRYEKHCQGKGAEWTKKYKPIKILYCKKGDKSGEEKTTLDTMNKYGYENVRGGSYCKLQLTQQDINYAKHQHKHYNDLCYKCGRKGHYSNSCETKKSDVVEAEEEELLLSALCNSTIVDNERRQAGEPTEYMSMSDLRHFNSVSYETKHDVSHSKEGTAAFNYFIENASRNVLAGINDMLTPVVESFDSLPPISSDQWATYILRIQQIVENVENVAKFKNPQFCGLLQQLDTTIDRARDIYHTKKKEEKLNEIYEHAVLHGADILTYEPIDDLWKGI